MTQFGHLKVEPLDEERAGLGVFQLLEDFRAVDDVRGEIVVRAGYKTDFASIPRVARWLLPCSGKAARAAVLHDWVLARGVTETTLEQRRWATGVFNRALRADGCGTVRRFMMVGFVAAWTAPDLYL